MVFSFCKFLAEKNHFFKTLVLFLLLSFPFFSAAQLTKDLKQQTIVTVIKKLKKTYVFPKLADSVEQMVNHYYAKGKYDSISTESDFAFQLTRDLQNITHDQHLKISFINPAPIDVPKQNDSGKSGKTTWIDDLLKDNNFGVKEKKILEGNIGYLNMPVFGPLDKCADTLIAAMKYVENTDALIIDLRSCRGSLDENTIPFLHSYFFKESVHLSDFYIRETDNTKQFWTSAWLPGKRYIDKPVYILTSGRTFSGGEAFAYDLQQHKRAIVIGEITRGGANPTNLEKVNTSFNIAIPYARSVNTVTKTNWEQVGVLPDSLIKANRALYLASLSALIELKQTKNKATTDAEIQRIITMLKSNKPVLRKVTFTLGNFPNAATVVVSGSFNFYSHRSLILKKDVNGVWTGSDQIEPGEINYSFIVDGKSHPDPKVSKTVQINGVTNSVTIVN